MKVRLHDVAHSRAGDKGNLNTLSLIPYDPDWYLVLCALATAEAVAAHLADRVVGPVVRHRMDGVHALIFVCPRDADDTVTSSLHLDTHGKSLSSALLQMEIEVGDGPGPGAAAPGGATGPPA
ncbi:hypothetical protein CLV63_10376 [Murinocardiopsis flavida]|uniref:AtuA-like ferredoxin-fold domain-containing protein n=1 Tax=Murinocardiopsis flavida TaxID=645275 RepID=A0A2P8DQ58_9ACTN|nr:hypothetical protein [Murinocardiopsis flavida]PSK99353.1 hypothetical protein CLV63_10376 [Murinocardiopsis flavida]